MPGQHQHAGIVGILHRDEFFRDEVHPIPQRGDTGNACAPQQCQRVVVLERAFQEQQRVPIDRAVLLAQAVGQLSQSRAQSRLLRRVCAG